MTDDQSPAPAAAEVDVITVVLVDDQPLLRAGLTAVLESQPDVRVVGQAGDGAEGVAVVRRLAPRVALFDVRMPVLDGVAAVEQLLAEPTPTRVLMLSTFDEDEAVFRALSAGASGFLLKDAPPESLLHAVRAADAGDTLLAPALLQRLVAAAGARPAEVDAPVPDPAAAAALEELTPREVDVLTHIARGLANKDIARELFVSEATVKSHVARIFAKLGVRDRVGAVIAAYDAGLVRAR